MIEKSKTTDMNEKHHGTNDEKQNKKVSSNKKKKRKGAKKWLIRFAKIALGLIAVLLVFTFLVWLFFGRQRLTAPEDILWGATYSPLAAEDLNMDPSETFRTIVEDLRPDKLRLVAYWNRIEKHPNEYDFSELDEQVDLADAHNIPFIISVGRRVPRYPECHAPEWSEKLSQKKQDAKVLELIEKTMVRYDERQNLVGWQIENEPFLSSFGICPDLNENLLREEINLARTLTEKTIMTTESGELSFWLKASKYPDVLGTTLYRRVLVSGTDVAINHIFPSWYYRARSNIALALRDNLDSVIVAELQGEPWTTKGTANSTQEEIARTMNPEQFEKNIDFTENVGFPEIYWWGVEWWLYEKQRGNDYYWERARELFQ